MVKEQSRAEAVRAQAEADETLEKAKSQRDAQVASIQHEQKAHLQKVELDKKAKLMTAKLEHEAKLATANAKNLQGENDRLVAENAELQPHASTPPAVFHAATTRSSWKFHL